ncbi:MAG: Hsp70 suppressor, GTPase facilitates ribosomal subunit dissociation [Watsoniomyces obsoletus]|nr:MAG: Hsp70 suppressor, GTPase facilitates ribosomal subunit dissociation [Watsoniomyces obsoletus]
MSRHRLVKGLDLEDELTDFAGGDGDDDYEDGAETEMTEEDKVQMQRCTTQVRNAFDPNMPPLSDKEIQDSLWYYYYDVGKTVHWLQGVWVVLYRATCKLVNISIREAFEYQAKQE